MIFTKKPENLRDGALCRKLTIYKQLSSQLNTLRIFLLPSLLKKKTIKKKSWTFGISAIITIYSYKSLDFTEFS